MQPGRPYVLSIAGFDPCSGAGITADIKTFDNNKVYGLGVCTSITYQNEDEFEGLQWVSVDDIAKQIKILLKKYKVEVAKIGIIENLEILEKTVCLLKFYNKSIKIIWDPVLKASAGFQIHNNIDNNLVNKILSYIYLVTPNIVEYKLLFNNLLNYSDLRLLIKSQLLCNFLIKGGHKETSDSDDVLVTDNEIIIIQGERIPNISKHGTGCILSSAIAANVALGNDLSTSCNNAKKYINKILVSNNGLLAYHKE